MRDMPTQNGQSLCTEYSTLRYYPTNTLLTLLNKQKFEFTIQSKTPWNSVLNIIKAWRK